MANRKIYVASSWRNVWQPSIVELLRLWGHEVYDFRNPAEGNHGFSWKQLHEGWENWTPAQFVEALKHPIAQGGFNLDAQATDWADTCVLVLPSGRSAHLEAGKMRGEGKELHIFMPAKVEPELMYCWATGIHTSKDALRASLEGGISAASPAIAQPRSTAASGADREDRNV